LAGGVRIRAAPSQGIEPMNAPAIRITRPVREQVSAAEWGARRGA
jgi:hypothetical protein